MLFGPKALLFSMLAFSISMLEAESSENSSISGCPLWEPRNTSSSAIREAVKCTEGHHGDYHLSLLPCYCLTEYHHNSSLAVAALCPYTCSTKNTPLLNYISLPANKNAKNITSLVCQNLSRTGQMCGECESGYAPAVYSYSLDCVNCTDHNLNWLKYIVIAFGPQTLFFGICVFSRLTVTSGSLVGFVTVSQVLVTGIEIRFKAVEIPCNYPSRGMLKAIVTLYSIWNLDFFRALYSPFCLNPNVSILAVIALDYAVALYPMVLIVMTYTCLTVYDKYRTIFRFSALFHRFIYRYYQMFQIRNSMIDAFATMLILSYVKILNTSFRLLLTVRLVDQSDEVLESVVYYSGNLKRFGKDHLPYAILAILMLLAFNIFPIIVVTLYPCRCFQKCMLRWKGATFHIIMDHFYRGYKIFPRDCRYFAAFYLYVRVINLGLLFVTLSPAYLSLVSTLYLTMAMAIGVVQPHKVFLHNIINAGLFFVIAILKLLELTIDFALPIYYGHKVVLLYVLIEVVLYHVPPVYGLLLLAFHIVPKKVRTCFAKKLKEFTHKCKSRNLYEESFPHRVSHADEYSHLINANSSQ